MVDRNELRRVIKEVYNIQSNNIDDVVKSYKKR